jgi:hypothetical protein
MCDKIIKKNLEPSEIPQYVYKRVQKVGENQYISPVMGEPIPFNKWKKAPKLEEKFNIECDSSALIDQIQRKYTKRYWTCSSPFSKKHSGMWGVFANLGDAEEADLVSNFMMKESGFECELYPTLIVKCEIKGTVHKSKYEYRDTYMASHIKIVEEVKSLG